MKKRQEKILTNSPEETKKLAEKLAGMLERGDILALEGELGSGKTQFVQGLARGLGVPENRYVRSPSFIILNEYRGRLPLYHFDFYRLHHSSDLDSIGMEEYFDGDGITVVEWANKFPGALPERAIHIIFEIIDDKRRTIKFNNKSYRKIRSTKSEIRNNSK